MIRDASTVPSWEVNGRTYTFYHKDYKVACGGDEVPFRWGNKTYLVVLNTKRMRQEIYCYDDDLFIKYRDRPWVLFEYGWDSE